MWGIMDELGQQIYLNISFIVMAQKNGSTLQESLILEQFEEMDKCSESDEESEERELLRLKKEIKQKMKRRKENKKVYVGSGFSFDITEYFKFKKKKENQNSQNILHEIGGRGGYSSWLFLLFAVVNAAVMPSWSYSINATKFVGFGWRFFIQFFLLIPFIMYEYRAADENTKAKYQFSSILRATNVKRIFLSSLSVFFWFFCVGTLSEWTQISHVLALGGLANFFLSIDRRQRNSGHDLQPGGQVLVIVGIFLIFQDSYSLSLDRVHDGAWHTSIHNYLDRNATERLLADLGALISSFVIAKLSQTNVQVQDSYPPYLSLMITSLFTTINLILAAFFFNGATFNFDETWGVLSLFLNEKQDSLIYMGFILIFGLILSYTVISKIYPNPLIPALAMSFQPILSSLILHLTGIQFIPGPFACIGYIFMLLGNFLILIGQWMFQKIHKQEEIEQKALLSELVGAEVRKYYQPAEKKTVEMRSLRKKKSINMESMKKEIKSKLKKKVSLDISFEEINDALKEKKDYKKYDGDLPQIKQID